MSYYSDNAIYKELRNTNAKNVYWVSQNAWILVYGDNTLQPKVVVLAHNEKWSIDESIVNITKTIARNANLPMLQIGFDSSKLEIETVNLRSFDGTVEIVSLVELTKLFQKYGLPVSNTETRKAVNDAESSAYHHWQRTSLGKSLCVADIDLIKLKSDGHLVLIELKRSFYSLESWKPFDADFNNFYLLENLCRLANCNFYILYNRRVTKPVFFDDPSRISVFAFNNGSPIKLGEYDFSALFGDK